MLAGLLRDAGFEVDAARPHRGAPEPRRAPARRRRRARRCACSRTSTPCSPTPAEWQRDPWSGDVVDGELWGRGAQDMKSQTAAEVAAAVALAREGWRPARGDLLVVCVVDEETGGGEGAIWLCENHPDAVRCDCLLNEGAGRRHPLRRRAPLRRLRRREGRLPLHADAPTGVAGHASMPRIGDNALLKLAPLLEAMGDRQPAFDVTEAPRALLAELGLALDGDPAPALDALRERDPILAVLVEPMLGVTLAPTMHLRLGEDQRDPVARASCRSTAACRRAWARTTCARASSEVLGDDGYELEFTEKVVGNGSPADSPLMDAIARLGRARGPGRARRADDAARPSPTRAPSAPRSPSASPTASSRSAQMTLYEIWPLVHGARRAHRRARPRVRRALLPRRRAGAARMS